MGERVLFTDSLDFLSDTDYSLIDSMDFGDDIGHAVILDADETPEALFEKHDEVIDAHYNVEFSIMHKGHKAPIDQDRLAEMEDYRGVHDFSEDAPGDGAGKTVAAMDSGVDTSHPVFEGVNVEKRDFTNSDSIDTVGHGTAVLGQVTRVAPEADLIMLRVFGDKGRASFRTILRAYKWVFNHADKVDVLNMSLGTRQQVPKLDQIHNKLKEMDIRDVVAAGNSGGHGGSPATAKTAFSVGATDDDGKMVQFSSHNPSGSNPEVVAIGKNNRLAKSKNAEMGKSRDGRWVKASGTSFAAPLVAGFVACMLSADVDRPRKRLAKSAKDITGTPRDGQGLVKYMTAVEDVEIEDTETNADVWNFAGGDTVHLKTDWLADGDYTVEKTTDDAGNTVLTFAPADQNA